MQKATELHASRSCQIEPASVKHVAQTQGHPVQEGPSQCLPALEHESCIRDQHRNDDPKLEARKKRPVVMVRYVHCCQCAKSTMILAKPEECEYCGHLQCADCEQWLNLECHVFWLKKS